MFKTTVKIDMGKIAALRFVPSQDKKKISYDFEVTLRDGAKHTLTILTKIDLDKKKTAIVSRGPDRPRAGRVQAVSGAHDPGATGGRLN